MKHFILALIAFFSLILLQSCITQEEYIIRRHEKYRTFFFYPYHNYPYRYNNHAIIPNKQNHHYKPKYDFDKDNNKKHNDKINKERRRNNTNINKKRTNENINRYNSKDRNGRPRR